MEDTNHDDRALQPEARSEDEDRRIRIVSLECATRIMAAQITARPIEMETVADVLRMIERTTRSIILDVRPVMIEAPSTDDDRKGRVKPKPEPREPVIRPDPLNPLAAPHITTAERIAGTVHEDGIECLECGGRYKLLKTHLKVSHDDMPWDEYLERHRLPIDYPAAPQWYKDSQRRKILDKRSGASFRTGTKRLPMESGFYDPVEDRWERSLEEIIGTEIVS